METRRHRADELPLDVRDCCCTQIRIQERVAFSVETDAYEGNAILPDGLHLCYPIWPDDLEEVPSAADPS
jgi:hypothetical protein